LQRPVRNTTHKAQLQRPGFRNPLAPSLSQGHLSHPHLLLGWWMVVAMERPPAARSCSRLSRCMAVVESRPEVGSSSRRTAGLMSLQRADTHVGRRSSTTGGTAVLVQY
jgi:hypothetical protein